MPAPRKTTSARRPSKAAVEANASAAAVKEAPAVEESVADQLPLVEEAAPTEVQPEVAPAPDQEQPANDVPEAPVSDLRAAMLAKFVTPEAAVSEPEPEAPVAVPETGNATTLPAGDTRALVKAVCVVDLFILRIDGVQHQLYKGDTVTGPAEQLAHGVKHGALVERG